MFSVNLSKKRARDEKFGKNGGISQIFGFYSFFIAKYFRIFGKIGLENLKKAPKNSKKVKNPLYGLLYGLEMVKFDFS